MVEKVQKKYKLILASSSPRRKEILEKMNLEFEIISSDYEEKLDNSKFSYEKIEMLACYKGKTVLDKINKTQIQVHPLILSADTVVVLNDEILGKPKNKEDAFRMLKQLSGKKHRVVTSICVVNSQNSNRKILSTTSYVQFKELSDNLINEYIEMYNPLDKAGSYGIQELPEGFVEYIEGSFENIIGLCPVAVWKILKEFIY